MLQNLLLGVLAMVACLFIQAMLATVAFVVYRRNRKFAESPTFFSTLVLISAVMMVLVLGNFVQIGVWAFLFMRLGEFTEYYTAFYHSAVNFATLGYGDIVMSEDHRILGPMQSVNGVLMIGVSTAVMMSTLQDALKRTDEARRSPGA